MSATPGKVKLELCVLSTLMQVELISHRLYYLLTKIVQLLTAVQNDMRYIVYVSSSFVYRERRACTSLSVIINISHAEPSSLRTQASCLTDR